MQRINFSSNYGYKNVLFSIRMCSTSTTCTVNTKSTSNNYKVLFLGNELFSLASLKQISQLVNRSLITVVISHLNNPIIGKFCKVNSLKTIEWNEFKSSISTTSNKSEEDNQFDIGVVAAFGHLIPENVIKICKLGILNVHGSILPRWRGASPIAHSLINGDKTTGISIMRIAPHRFDVGPILHTNEIDIPPHVKEPELRSLLAEIGAQELCKVLNDLPTYLSRALPQDDAKSSLAPKVTQELSVIDWRSQSSTKIYNLYRGLWGAFKLNSTYNARKVDFDEIGLLKFLDCDSDNSNENVSENKEHIIRLLLDHPLFESKVAREYGEILYSKNENIICVYCLDNSWIFIRKIKIGTKWMSAKDFQNGFLSKNKGKQSFVSPLNDLENVNMKCQ